MPRWYIIIYCILLGKIILAYPVLTSKTESIPNYALINLKNQISFNYIYKFRTNIPHQVTGEFKGLVVFPNQEERNGVLERNNKKNNYKTKARGNYQYDVSKRTSKWQIVARDENSNIMITLDRTLANARFNLIKEDDQYYTYKFPPNLVFLDPTFTRKITAQIVIGKKNLLPVEITAQDSTQKIYWRVEFSDFNNKKRIKFPFLANTKIVIASQARLSAVEINAIKNVITRRLDFAGENFRIKAKKEKTRTVYEINLDITEQNPDYKLLKNLLTSPGHLNIMPVVGSISLLNESNMIDYKIVSFEPYPMIELSLDENGTKKMNESLNNTENKSSFRVLLDSFELSRLDIDKYVFLDKILFRVLTNKNEIMNTIAILKGGTLAHPLEIIDIWSGK